LPQYHPTPCPQSSASSPSGDESQMSKYGPMDAQTTPSPTTQHQWLQTQVVEAQSTGEVQEERPFQHRPTSTSIRTSKYKREDRTSQDPLATKSTGSESSTSNDPRISDPGQSRSRSCAISPILPLSRARVRAHTIVRTPGFPRQEQTGLRERSRAQNAYDGATSVDGKRPFRSHESPFTHRVKEKLRQRQAHALNEELPRKPHQRTAELRASTRECNREPDTPGTKFKFFMVCLFSHLEPLSQEREQLSLSTRNASCADGEESLRRTQLFNLPEKPKLLMGPRKCKLSPGTGSVMKRVRMLEELDSGGQERGK
jgi:hypothetical protein